MRINRYLASCGIASRRKCEDLVVSGRITINDKIETNLSLDIKENDVVKLDGALIRPNEIFEYYVLNKPKGYISSVSDDRGRKVVTSLIDTKARIYPVGRLDYNSEGMLLLTNDGELMNKLTHPKHLIGKTYNVVILGAITESALEKLRKGVIIDNYQLEPCKIKVLQKLQNKTKLQITIFEGRNREIRKMFEVVNKTVIKLERVKIADFELKNLKRGEYRKLTQKEVGYLKSL